MSPLAVSAYTASSALGHGRDAHASALVAMRGGLRENDFSSVPLPCWIGRVDGLEDQPLHASLAPWDCRNNRLAWQGLNQDGFLDAARAAVDRHGASRVAVMTGTSTGGIGHSEEAYRHLHQGRLAGGFRDRMPHSLHSLGSFVAAAVGSRGPCLTTSTACSSSAKVYAMAARLMQLDLIDAAVVGGTDTLCDSVLFGFNSLELVSANACRPFDVARDGISIGEAAAFALLERTDAAPLAPRLVGYGESSDAWHMSTPHPEGLGAEKAMREALARANLSAGDVDYIHLHGTASQKNDSVEATLVKNTFPDETRMSSTKGYTGHTLGAAGALGAVVALLAIERDFVPGNLGCTTPDPACGPQLTRDSRDQSVRIALSNAFGFGGNNACLVFAAAGAAA